MKTTIKKWGNSLAVRIPGVFATEAGLGDNSAVDVVLSEKRLIITPCIETEPSLDVLLSLVTDDNMHTAIDSGVPRGNEAW